MNKNSLKPWEMMRETKEAIGMPALERIFRVGHSQLYKTMRNPDYVGDAARPPFVRLRLLLQELDEAEAKELALAILNYIAEGIDMQCIPLSQGAPDKACLAAECLDDYPPLTLLHKAIEEKADPREVQAWAEKAKGEIDETVVAYRKSIQKKLALSCQERKTA